MKKILLASLVLASLGCFAVQAQDAPGTTTPANGDWTGSGELGFASTTGNTRSQNLDAKLGLNQENAQWKNSFFLDALRSKSQVTVELPNGSPGEEIRHHRRSLRRWRVGGLQARSAQLHRGCRPLRA